MITIYKVLKNSGVNFTHKALCEISVMVSKELKSDLPKIPQEETWGETTRTFKVRPYEDEKQKAIEEICIDYFVTIAEHGEIPKPPKLSKRAKKKLQ